MGRLVEVTEKTTLDSCVRRFETNRWLTGMGGRLYFSPGHRPASAPEPPEGSLEAKLVALDGVLSVYVYGNTVTVQKEPQASWEDLSPGILETIRHAFSYYSEAALR